MDTPAFTLHMQISDIINRYFAAVDDKCLTLPVIQAAFAPDARMVRPNGSVLSGCEEIFEGQQKSFARFRATHHVITNYLVDINGDTATIRANVTAMHVWNPEAVDPYALESYFQAGGVLRSTVRLTEDGWRMTELSNKVQWRSGSGVGMMINFEKGEGR